MKKPKKRSDPKMYINQTIISDLHTAATALNRVRFKLEHHEDSFPIGDFARNLWIGLISPLGPHLHQFALDLEKTGGTDARNNSVVS